MNNLRTRGPTGPVSMAAIARACPELDPRPTVGANNAPGYHGAGVEPFVLFSLGTGGVEASRALSETKRSGGGITPRRVRQITNHSSQTKS
jgi:hypothetical protein